MSLLEWIQRHGCQSQTTMSRATLGLAAGAVTGGLIIGAALSVIFASSAIQEGFFQQEGRFIGSLYFVMLVVFATLYSTVVFAIGLAAVTPLWWGLHRIGVRCWSAASPLGALLAGGTMLAFTQSWLAAGALAGIGAIVGAVIWRVAYRSAGSCAVGVG